MDDFLMQLESLTLQDLNEGQMNTLVDWAKQSPPEFLIELEPLTLQSINDKQLDFLVEFLNEKTRPTGEVKSAQTVDLAMPESPTQIIIEESYEKDDLHSWSGWHSSDFAEMTASHDESQQHVLIHDGEEIRLHIRLDGGVLSVRLDSTYQEKGWWILIVPDGIETPTSQHYHYLGKEESIDEVITQAELGFRLSGTPYRYRLMIGDPEENKR